MMFWSKRKKAAEAELRRAQEADAESRQSVEDARDTYRKSLATARAAQRVNTRNHFSERLNAAFGG